MMPYANPEQTVKYQREYNEKNRDRIRARQRIYNQLHREEISRKMSEYYKKNKSTPEFKERRKQCNAKRRVKHRAYMLKAMYGITSEQYQQMFTEQNGVCAICKKPESSKRINHMHVDHRHSDGKVRGLLCHSCNTALGGFKEDAKLLAEAIAYLSRTT